MSCATNPIPSLRRLLFGAAVSCAAGLPAIAADPPCYDDVQFPNGIGTVRSVFRTVTIMRDGSNFRAGPRTVLCRNDIVITDPGARARISLHVYDAPGHTPLGQEDAGILNIGPDSRLSIAAEVDPILALESNFLLDLYRGVIRFYRRAARSMRPSIRVSSVICGIRGTTMVSRHDPGSGGAEHMVAEGVLACEAGDGTVTVEAGQSVTISRGVIGQVTPLDPSAFAAASALTDAMDGWSAARAALPFDLPDTDTLPGACRAPAEVGFDVATRRYRYCDSGTSAIYTSCAFTRCMTGAEIAGFLRERPGLTAEPVEGSCRPACNTADGFARLEFYRHGAFCGRCAEGTRWHRGHGCCR